MLDTGTDAERGNQGFPHGLGGADDVIAMPLQCSTQWDGLGHIFDHGYAWNGRRAGDVVTSDGDLVTGIEHAASAIVSRGVLLDLGRHLRPETGELPDGYAITAADLRSCVEAQGATSAVGTGDIVLVRTGQLARVRRDGWGEYAGGPAPGLSLTTAGWLHDTGDRRDRDRHLGLRGAAERVRRAGVPAAAPGRHPEHRSHHRRDVGPGGARDRVRAARADTISSSRPRRCRSRRPSGRRSTPSRCCSAGSPLRARASRRTERFFHDRRHEGRDRRKRRRGARHRHPARQGRCRGRRLRVQARAERARLGHHAAGQRAARLRRARRLGRRAGEGLLLRRADAAGAGSGRAGGRRAARGEDGRSRLPGDRRHVPPGPRAHPARPRAGARARTSGSARRSPASQRPPTASRWRSTARPRAPTTCWSAPTGSTRPSAS